MHENLLHGDLTEKIISAFYRVYNILGYGFLEKVYENALVYELVNMNLSVEQQRKIDVYYGNAVVGIYYADLCVNNLVIIELKAAETILEEHDCQLLNYLKATEIEVGLLLNFGKQPAVRRKVYSNHRKLF